MRDGGAYGVSRLLGEAMESEAEAAAGLTRRNETRRVEPERETRWLPEDTPYEFRELVSCNIPKGAGVFDVLADVCVVIASPGGGFDGGIEKAVSRDLPHWRVVVQTARNGSGMSEREASSERATALAHAMMHAIDAGATRLLVLHEGFHLGDDRDAGRARLAAKNIQSFLKGRIFDTYNLGRLAFVGYPVGKGTWVSWASCAAHAVLYSERFMRRFIETQASGGDNSGYLFNSSYDNYVHGFALVFKGLPEYGPFSRLTRLGEWSQPGFRTANWASIGVFCAAVIIASLVTIFFVYKFLNLIGIYQCARAIVKKERPRDRTTPSKK